MTETTEKSTALSNESYVRHSMAIMDKWGNGEAYDEKIIVDRGKHCQRTMVESMLEFGRVLIILKEHMAHGKFQETLEHEFNVTPRAAQKFMQATLKFCGEGLQDTTPKLVQLGKSKLLELVTQDDDDLKELAEGGTVAGLKLDEVDRMSVQELRKALRNAKAEKEAMGKVLANKDNKINELDVELAKKKKDIETRTPDKKGGDLRKETSQIAYGAEAILRGQVRPAFDALLEHTEESGMDHTQFMSGVVAEIELILIELKETYGLNDVPSVEADDWENQSDKSLGSVLDEIIADQQAM
ncbi:DUF3102 domain-containing protein [Bisgaard Taxon 10/6]|uniref:DUF3102 domain-containing protein n=1 Tax=Exercitatus varius TaxID=67857 RepID=A0AAW6Q9B5_9PAST|nr:DUF3102 domain-containing protein [Exercitatus varius]MDG2949331.1 DUF3102 domain-containing protein [Exercitatus varius]MDG2959858.1 DUF3102 domain-containing protein [Exercitatus varius]